MSTVDELRVFWTRDTFERARDELVTIPARPELYNDAQQLQALASLLIHTPEATIGGETILDYGCGVGRMSRALVRCGATVIGVDVSPAMLEHAASYVNSDRFRPVLCDGTDCGDVGEATVDGAICVYCLQHMSTWEMIHSVLTSICRVVRPGGWFVLQSAYDPGAPADSSPVGFCGVRQPVQQMLNAVTACRFEPIAVQYPFEESDGPVKQYLMTLVRSVNIFE